MWLAGLALPSLILTGFLAYIESSSLEIALSSVGMLALLWWLAAIVMVEQLIRPLHTLSNVVSALREEDFSFRARDARRGDALGDLACEINALADTLQRQSASALDALTLVERVLTSMQSPVLAFDDSGHLRLHNTAAQKAFALPLNAVGLTAVQLQLAPLLALPDQGLYPAQPDGPTRWSVRRATFRLRGLPHTLLVLADVAAALREEERLAWRRLIRVLSHEINNSLTPIQSIAGSLRSRLASPSETHKPDLLRGLGVIEDRATSLNRFLQAYQKLARLPAPAPRPTELPQLLAQAAQLETRLSVHVESGSPLTLSCDPDQIQQALINLVQNAADSALSAAASEPHLHHIPQVSMTWHTSAGALTITVRDNGLGISNTANLFVPFYTTKPHGSGIGLVLAQQIASAHAGSIAILPNAGEPGCTAYFTLPLNQPVQPATPAPSTSTSLQAAIS